MSKKAQQYLIWIGVVIVAAVVVFSFYDKKDDKPASTGGDLSAFAQCIADSGAKFYGAFWCSHCENQKQAFGSAADKLPYVECSAPDGNSQLTVCSDNGITGYPTWVFAG